MISIWVFIVATIGFLSIIAHLWYTKTIVELNLDSMTDEFYNAYLVAQCYIEKHGEMSVEEMQKTKVIREARLEMAGEIEEEYR